MFALRRQALQASLAPIVLVTEDHCVPSPWWAVSLLDALDGAPAAVAAAGPVHDGLRGGAWDRAAFLVDYAGLLPGRPFGPTATLPGMNTAYRREALLQILAEAPEILDDFWEGAAHRRLARRGSFLWVPDASLAHTKRYGAAHALTQRFLQGRHVGGCRSAGLPPRARLGWTVAAAAVPGVVLPRILGPTLRRAGLPIPQLAATLPPILALVGAWAVGEAIGAALGPGDALGRVV